MTPPPVRPVWLAPLCAAALLLLSSLRVLAGGGPTGVIVVYDPVDLRSVTIAQRYQAVRGIPEGNMVPYPFPVSFNRTTAWDFINSLRATLAARGLTGQVQAIALAGIFPLDGAQGFTGGAALSTECLLYYSPNFSHASAPVSQSFTNPAFVSAQSAFAGSAPMGTTSLAGRTFAGQSFWPVSAIGHCGKSGNSPREILGFLERARLSDGTKPQGTIYWPLNSDVRSTTRESEIGAVSPIWSARGISSLVYGSSTTGLGWVSNRRDIVGGMVGIAGITTVNAGNRYLPGSWADHLTSYGAVFDSLAPGQTTCAAWLRAGVDGSAGTMTEPYAIAGKFPHAHIYTHFRAGASLAEAFWLSLQSMAEGMCFGDPLLQPWADFPQVAIAAPGEGSTVGGQLALTASATPAAGKTLEPLCDLFVDGRRIALSTAAETVKATRTAGGFQLDTTTLPDGWHDLRVVAYNADSVRTQAEARRSVFVSNAGQSVTLTGPATFNPDAGVRVTVSAAGFTDLASLTVQANGRVVAPLSVAGGVATIPGGVAPLDGPWSLFAVARRAGGQEIRSAPLTLTSVWPALPAFTPAPSFGPGMGDVRYFASTTAAGFSWDSTPPDVSASIGPDGANGLNLTGVLDAGTLTTNVPGVTVTDFTARPGFELSAYVFAPTDDWYEFATDYVGGATTGHETAVDGTLLAEHNSVFGPAHLAAGWHWLRLRTKLTASTFTQMKIWSRGGALQDFAVLNRANAASAGSGYAPDAPSLTGISASADPVLSASATLTGAATIGGGSADDLASLTYWWSLLGGPAATRYETTTATFTANGTNAARTTVVKFTQPGTYTVGLLVAGPAGAITATRTLTVSSTSTKLLLDRGNQSTLLRGDLLPLYACTVDQFNLRLPVAPANPALPTVQWTTTDPAGSFLQTTADGESTNFRSLSAASGTAQNFTVTATGVNGRTGSASFTVTVNPNTPLAISGTRLFNITQSGAGKPVTFTASVYDADNSSGRYTQFLWTVVSAPAGQALALSSASLSTVTGTPTGSGSYTIRLDAGDQTGFNLTATQTFTYDAGGVVSSPLSIGTPTNPNPKAGDTATISAVVSGIAASLQWQSSADGGATWQDLAGQTSASTTYGPVQAADSGRQFRLVGANASGTVTGPATALTVQSPAAGVIGFPGGAGITGATLSVNENAGPATLILRRSGGSTGLVSVTLTLYNSTALLGSDYRGFDGASQTTTTLSWPDGDATDRSVSVPIIDDALPEATKQCYVLLSSPTGGALLSSRTYEYISIVDDDGPGTAYFVTPAVTVSENAGAATLTVGRRFPYTGALSVQYSTHALATDTASGGDDYTITAGTLTWASGDSTTRQISIPILRDSLVEGDEVFTVGLSASDSTLIGTPATAAITIQDAPYQKWQAQQWGAALPVLPAYSTTAAAIRALGPLFHFRLSETSGATVSGVDATGAVTASGALSGTGFALAQTGPRPALWLGLESTNTALALTAGSAGGTPLAWQTGGSANCGTAAGFGAKLGLGGTVSLWLKTSDSTHAMALLGGTQNGTNTRFLLNVNAAWNTTSVVPYSAKILLRGEGASNTAEYSVTLQSLPTGSLCDGQWHHLAVTWPKFTSTDNVDYARFFFDGSEANALAVRGTETLSNTATFADFTDAGLRLGASGTSPSTYFAGSLDEIAFFPRVLSPAEVGNLATAGPPPALPAAFATEGDASGSGQSNFLKYFLGASALPGAPVVLPAPSLTKAGGQDYLALSYQQNPAATDIAPVVEVSADLLHWDSGAAFTTVVSDVTAGGLRQVTVRDNVPVSQGAHRYIRLHLYSL